MTKAIPPSKAVSLVALLAYVAFFFVFGPSLGKFDDNLLEPRDRFIKSAQQHTNLSVSRYSKQTHTNMNVLRGRKHHVNVDLEVTVCYVLKTTKKVLVESGASLHSLLCSVAGVHMAQRGKGYSSNNMGDGPFTGVRRQKRPPRRCRCVLHINSTETFPHMTCHRCEQQHGLVPDPGDSSYSDDSDSSSSTGSSNDDQKVPSDESEGDQAGFEDEEHKDAEQITESEVEDIDEGDDSELDEGHYLNAGSDSASSSGSESEVDVESRETEKREQKIRSYAREILELLANGNISEKGVQSMSEIFHGLLRDLLGEKAPLVCDLPRTIFMIQKWGNVESMGSVLLDICPCCELFVYPDPARNTPSHGRPPPSDDPDHDNPHKPVPLTHCPRPSCGAPRSQERQMMVGGVVKQIQAMFESPEIAQVISLIILFCSLF